MKIEELDENFKQNGFKEFAWSGEKAFPDAVWRDATDEPFSLCGVTYTEEEGYKRLPDAVAAKVSEGVRGLAYHTSGGRVSFRTDSPYIVVYCKNRFCGIMSHMTIVGTFGVSLYVNGKFDGIVFPNAEDVIGEEKKPFGGVRYPTGEGVKDIELYMPLYAGLDFFAIGLKEGSIVEKPREFSVKKPIIFYGSSITQGGCASRPGNDYAALVARKLDADYINLGFSGNAKGERAMAEYIAGLDSSAFVLDYDHNAPSAEYLENTLYPFYEIVRSAKKDIPIIFMSKPDYENAGEERRKVVESAYRKAVAAGDKKVSFIDGRDLFGKEGRDGCTVDTCHPNDLGFYRMAEAVYPVLKEYLK